MLRDRGMKRPLVIGFSIAAAVIVVVSAGSFFVAGQIRDALQGHCRQSVISHYEALRDSIATEIRAAALCPLQRPTAEKSGFCGQPATKSVL